MTNLLVLLLSLLIVGVFALDVTWLHWDLPLRAGRQFVAMVDWIEFWR